MGAAFPAEALQAGCRRGLGLRGLGFLGFGGLGC